MDVPWGACFWLECIPRVRFDRKIVTAKQHTAPIVWIRNTQLLRLCRTGGIQFKSWVQKKRRRLFVIPVHRQDFAFLAKIRKECGLE
mmetsp:Transcript_8681/g.8808  ORF Transcript_8681/g.8808 Transcript_8681/m.8808 type:complete len:87 (-) Transcript_8681:13-273(-)